MSDEQIKYLVKCAARQNFKAAVQGLLEAVDEQPSARVKIEGNLFRREEGWTLGMKVLCVSGPSPYWEGRDYTLVPKPEDPTTFYLKTGDVVLSGRSGRFVEC